MEARTELEELKRKVLELEVKHRIHGDLERSYTHQLGEMARLSDVVCSWALRQDLDEDPQVEVAAKEIMQYVDAVRPGEGEKKVEWVMHIIGPDDVIPCAGEFDALRKANQHNITFAKMMADDPCCVAVAELAC